MYVCWRILPSTNWLEPSILCDCIGWWWQESKMRYKFYQWWCTHSLSVPLQSAAVLTGGILLAGSFATQAMCAGAECVFDLYEDGGTCTCMLCSASLSIYLSFTRILKYLLSTVIVVPHTSSMNVLYWLEWAGGMVGSLAAISGRDCVGLSQNIKRMIKMIVFYWSFSPSRTQSPPVVGQSSCYTVGTDAHLSASDMAMTDLHYRIHVIQLGVRLGPWIGIAIENVWRVWTARYKASCSSWSRR